MKIEKTKDGIIIIDGEGDHVIIKNEREYAITISGFGDDKVELKNFVFPEKDGSIRIVMGGNKSK